MSHKHFSLFLPVFKQGDDLGHYLKDADPTPNNNAAAFLSLAEQYDLAAGLCRRVAGVLKESTGVEINANTHHIGFTVARDSPVLDGLLADEVISREEEDEEPDDDGLDEDLEDEEDEEPV